MRTRSMHGRLLIMVMASLVASSAAYAFTASNTVPSSSAGQGSSTISGYAATNVAYDIDNSDPQQLNSMTFTISPTTAATVKVKLSSNWHTCSNTAGNVRCPQVGSFAPSETVASASNLNIVAIENTDT